MERKIVIGSRNKAKVKEIEWALEELKNFGFLILNLDNFNIYETVEEKGNDFKDNAFIKAEFYFRKTGLPVITDDGGLIIPYLNNEPGVKSRRWLGYEASDEELITYTLERLKNARGNERLAYLTTTLCYYDGKNLFFAEERIRGFIAPKPSEKRIEGYPYRALFIVEKFNKYYDELTEEEHLEVNHRLKALKHLKRQILKVYGL